MKQVSMNLKKLKHTKIKHQSSPVIKIIFTLELNSLVELEQTNTRITKSQNHANCADPSDVDPPKPIFIEGR